MQSDVAIHDLPPDAGGAVEIIDKLRAAGHIALLAGGCVRDLLRGDSPKDYDVATSARPEEVCAMFRATRLVGAQFGVVLTRRRRRWVEVATFRSDGAYSDGRHPDSVRFSTPPEDAARRDFTINGMFLDPPTGAVIDYVGGLADLRAGVVRAIGDAATRFAEDHLRLLRAIRFAARLDYAIESGTFAALCAAAPRVADVAGERVLDELQRMLSASSRVRAVELMRDAGLLGPAIAGVIWTDSGVEAAQAILRRLPQASFEVASAVLLEHNAAPTDTPRQMKCSNAQIESINWLRAHHADLDDPDAPDLAALRRLLAHSRFHELRDWAHARFADTPNHQDRQSRLAERIAAVPADDILPAPFVTGDDLTARGVTPGPIFKTVLDKLYEAQLNLELRTRDAALARLAEELKSRR